MNDIDVAVVRKNAWYIQEAMLHRIRDLKKAKNDLETSLNDERVVGVLRASGENAAGYLGELIRANEKALKELTEAGVQ